MSDWFAAHKDGLRKIVNRLIEYRTFGIVAGELYQNVRDEQDATFCRISLTPIPNKAQAKLVCEDDGPGFRDLTHAWTMYAPSYKTGDPEKAGRFNVGEKFVLSLCREAKIATTSGTVEFDQEGRKEYPRRKRDRGTVFEAIIDCTREHYEQFRKYMGMLIVRPGLEVTFNGERVGLMDKSGYNPRQPLRVLEATLRTETVDEFGNIRGTERKTHPEIYEVLEGETAWLYELGIPVVETGDKWHVNIKQKVPLTVDRTNITPAYLHSVRTVVANGMSDYIEPEDTTTAWLNDATEDPNIEPQVMEKFLTEKYGKNRVAFDPTNPEANAAAVAAGHTLIPPRGLSPKQRENAYNHELLQSSSKAFPEAGGHGYSKDGTPVKYIPYEKWTDGMKVTAAYAEWLGKRLLTVRAIRVHFVNVPYGPNGKRWGAVWIRGSIAEIHFNVMHLGRRWFEEGITEKVDRLLIHEMGHQYASNHLSDEYYDGLCDLGAKLKALALDNPEAFAVFDSWDTCRDRMGDLTGILPFADWEDEQKTLQWSSAILDLGDPD